MNNLSKPYLDGIEKLSQPSEEELQRLMGDMWLHNLETDRRQRQEFDQDMRERNINTDEEYHRQFGEGRK